MRLRVTNRKVQTIKGVDYVYEPYVEWDPQKGCNVRKRRYIGKMIEGKFVANKNYELAEKLRSFERIGPDEVYGSSVQARLCGLTEFLEILSRRLGVTDDLEACFPNKWRQILSLAFYLGTEFTRPLNRFHRWALTHEHPAQDDIDDEELIALFKGLDEARIKEFLLRQVKRRAGRNTTIYVHDFFLSLQELAALIISGADPRERPRQKLLTLYSEASGLPCGYLACSRMESAQPVQLDALAGQLAEFGIEKPLIVATDHLLEDNALDWMLEHGWHFIVQRSDAACFVQETFGAFDLPVDADHANGWQWNERVGLYELTRVWMYSVSNAGRTRNPHRRVWVHCYYDPSVGETTAQTQQGRESVRTMLGDYDDIPRAYYHTFAGGLESKFGVRLLPNSFAWSSVKNRGFYVLLSNAKKEAFTALNAFRRQDFQYELFSNLCERMYLRPFSYGGSEPSSVLKAQLFLQFLGLVLFEATRKEHSRSGLWAQINHTNLLDELDTIQRYTKSGRGSTVSTLTPYQKEIYKKLGIRAPGSGKAR